MLFGIDSGAKALPWECNGPTPDDKLLTRQSFLKRIPALSLLHLSAFKDYLLNWAEYTYRDLEHDDTIWESFGDLTRGRYVPSRVQKATDVIVWTRANLSSAFILRSKLRDQWLKPMGDP